MQMDDQTWTDHVVIVYKLPLKKNHALHPIILPHVETQAQKDCSPTLLPLQILDAEQTVSQVKKTVNRPNCPQWKGHNNRATTLTNMKELLERTSSLCFFAPYSSSCCFAWLPVDDGKHL